MDNVPDNPGAAGDGGTGTAPTGGQQTSGGETVTHGGSVLPIDALPEQLRGLPLNQIKYLLTNMVSATQNTAKENRELKQKLEELSKSSPKGKTSRREPDEEGDDSDEKPLEELILENPEEAISRVIEKRFGKDISQFREGFGESVMHSVRAEIPDFREHEDAVREILVESRTPMTRENVMGAYLMALGQQQFTSRRQAMLEAEKMEKGRSDADDTKPKRTLSSLQKEVARGLGMSEDEYINEQDKWEAGTFDVRIPTGQAKAEAK